jgi:hypothetical protein
MMKITNPEQYLLPKPQAKPLNAVNENIAASLGQPINAFPDQDHLAHIQSHLNFIEDPFFGANPLMAAQAIGGLLQNVKEHMLLWYGMEIHRLASEAAKTDISQFMTIKDAEVQTKFDGMLAAATNKLHAESQQYFGKMPPIIQRAQAMLKQYSPPQPMDPSAVQQQKVQADTQTKQMQIQQEAQDNAADRQQKAQQVATQAATAAAQQQLDAQTAQGQAQVDTATNQNDNVTRSTIADKNNATKQQVVQAQDATKLTVTAEDNRVAEEIAGAEIAAGKHTNLKDGQAVGKKPTEGA